MQRELTAGAEDAVVIHPPRVAATTISSPAHYRYYSYELTDRESAAGAGAEDASPSGDSSKRSVATLRIGRVEVHVSSLGAPLIRVDGRESSVDGATGRRARRNRGKGVKDGAGPGIARGSGRASAFLSTLRGARVNWSNLTVPVPRRLARICWKPGAFGSNWISLAPRRSPFPSGERAEIKESDTVLSCSDPPARDSSIPILYQKNSGETHA